jgi:hypothetical protein
MNSFCEWKYGLAVAIEEAAAAVEHMFLERLLLTISFQETGVARACTVEEACQNENPDICSNILILVSCGSSIAINRFE